MAKIEKYCSCDSTLVAEDMSPEMLKVILDLWDEKHSGPGHEGLTRFQYIRKFWYGKPRDQR